MNFITYFIAILFASIANTVIKSLDIAYSLAVLLTPYDVSGAALLAGFFSGIFTAVCYFCAICLARKINKNREIKIFKEEASRSGMSEFEYAKSITPEKVISYCDSHLNDPIYAITAKLDTLPESNVISRPCADALIEGYTKIMEQHQL